MTERVTKAEAEATGPMMGKKRLEKSRKDMVAWVQQTTPEPWIKR